MSEEEKEGTTINPFRSPVVEVSWRDLRPRHFVNSLPIVLATAVTAILLMRIPVLNWGWWKALGGRGNILVADMRGNDTIASLSQTQHWVNVVFTLLPMFAVFLLLLFVFRLVASEEVSYRGGLHKRNWRGFIKIAVGFAAVHLIVGIPIAAAIALIIPGFFFGWKYLQAYKESFIASANEVAIKNIYQTGYLRLPFSGVVAEEEEKLHEKNGIRESTLYHAAYNITILLPVLIVCYFGVVAVL